MTHNSISAAIAVGFDFMVDVLRYAIGIQADLRVHVCLKREPSTMTTRDRLRLTITKKYTSFYGSCSAMRPRVFPESADVKQVADCYQNIKIPHWRHHQDFTFYLIR
jgi:hypothetical protein